MPFLTNANPVLSIFQFKKRDDLIVHELRRQGTAEKGREFFRAQGNVLFDLNCTEAVTSAFGLNRQDVMATASVQPHVEFIALHLPNAFHRSAKMVLERICHDLLKPNVSDIQRGAGSRIEAFCPQHAMHSGRSLFLNRFNLLHTGPDVVK